MSPEKRRIKLKMELKIKVEGRKLIATYNGKTTEHKYAFFRKLSFNDAFLYLTKQH